MTSGSYLRDVLRCTDAWLDDAERYCHGERTLGNVLEHIKAARRQVHAAEAMAQTTFDGPTREEGQTSMRYYTITDDDVGQPTIRAFGRVWPVVDFIGRVGRVLPQDMGKWVYLHRTADVLQVESSPQRAARLTTAQEEPTCECSDADCIQAITTVACGGHLLPLMCGRPAVMHLFSVAGAGGNPVDFCDQCGDNALQSGAFATGEDVAAALREAEEGQATERVSQLSHFSATWAMLLSQIDLRVVHHAVNVVLMAHDETCIECHNADQRARCPLRLRLVAVMTQERGG